MENKKQTAVNWLEIVLIPDPISEEDFEHNINCWKQAKKIEKQQIIDSNIAGMEFIAVDPNKYMQDSEQFYKETYE